MTDKDKKPAAPVIDLKPCKSSNISAYGYDASSKTLAIKFSSGLTYHYDKVEPEVFEKLGKAKSVGSFFATDIRNAFTGAKQPQKAKK